MADKIHRTRFELSAVDQATRVFKTVESGATSLQGKLTGLAAAASAVFAAGGALAFVADAVRYRGALDDLADTTGDNVRTLDGMARQARVTGLEFDRLSGLLTKFARNLNAVDDEGDAAGQAVEALGLNIDQLRAKKPAEAMVDIANALAEFDDGAGKVAVATALMGKSGAEALPYLKDLAEAGGLNGRITAEQAAQAERLEKEWRKLKVAFEDSKQELATALIPELAKIVEQLRVGIELAGGFGKALLLFGSINPFRSVQGNIEALNAHIEKLQQRRGVMATMPSMRDSIPGVDEEIADARKQLAFLKFQQRQDALRLTGPEYLDARDLMARQKPALNFQPKPKPKNSAEPASSPFENKLAELQKQLAGASTEGNFYSETMAELNSGKLKALDAATGKLRALTEAEKDQVRVLAAQITTARAAREADRERQQGLEEITRATDEQKRQEIARRDAYLDTTSASRQLLREEEELLLLRQKGLLTEQQYNEILWLRSERARAAISETSKEVELAVAAGQQMGLSFTSAFDQIIFGAGRSVKAMDVLKAAAQDVAKVIWGRTITTPLANGIGDAISGYFRSGARPFGPDAVGPGGAAPFGGFDSGAIAGMDFVGSFASGTNYVPRTGMALVHQGEKIIPAREASSGGGVNVVMHNTFEGGSVSPAQLAAVQKAAVAGVLEAKRRGGAFAEAF